MEVKILANKSVKIIFFIFLHSLITSISNFPFLAAANNNHDPLSTKILFDEFNEKLRDKEIDLTVPKIIHYIWLGGPIYEEYWLTITKMATIARENGYELWVWVDSERNLKLLKTVPKRLELNIPETSRIIINNDNFDHYVNKLKSIKVKSIYDLENQTSTLKRAPADFPRKLWKAIREEMVGLKNYGAASDLLRYLILYVYGGIYFDADEQVISSSLKVPQIGTITPTYGFQNNWEANSILISIKEHPFFLYVLSSSIQKLNELSPKYQALKRLPVIRIEGKDVTAFRKNLTIELTGPKLLVDARDKFEAELQAYFDKSDLEINDEIELASLSIVEQQEDLGLKRYIYPLFRIGKELLVHTRSEQTWLQGKNPKLVEE